MNRSFSVFTVCTLLLLVTACQNKEIIPESSESESKSKEEVPAVTVTGVSISPASHSMEVGETVQMEAIILPENATNKNVSWISLSPIVASVNETGLVTAHKQGNATIRVTTEQGRFIAECKITVGSTDTPPDTTPDPQPSGRWTDSGADVPAYPTYNTVSSKSDFPLVEIRTDSGNQPASKEYYEGGTVRFSDPKGMYKGQNDTDYSTDSGTLKMQIRGRGNSTWEGQNGSKNPYRIKLDEHTKVFGMKGDKDWILLSDKLDKSLIRTAVALRISRLVSMPWTPKYRMVHMTLNGKDKGLYYLVEQKEVDRDNKIPITIQPGVVDSGYLLELDNKWDNDDYFQSECFGKFVKYKDPDPNDEDSSQKMTSAQKKFITDYFNSVEHALEDRNWDKVHSLIEMDSWIQNYLVHEVTMNKDGNMRLSTYFAKDSDTKLFMPMVWDFDRSCGQDSYQKTEFNLPEWWPYGWFIRIRGGYPNGEETSWEWNSARGRRPSYYQYLFEDPEFVNRVKELWTLYKPRLDMIPDFIDKMLEYNNVMYTSDNKSKINTLRSEYIQRILWLDTNIKALKPQKYNSTTGEFEDL